MEKNTDIRSNLQNSTAKLWELIKNSAEAIKELKQENKAISEQNQLLHNMIDKKEDSSINLATKNSELLNQIKNLNYELNEKNRTISVLNDKIDIRDNDLHKLKDYNNIIEEKDRHIDELVLENESLLKEYRVVKNEKDKATIMLEQFENQSSHMSQEYVRLKDEFSELSQKYDNMDSKIASTESEIYDYKLLKNDYEKIKKSHADLNEKISELSELTKNHTQLKYAIENAEKENKYLKIKMNKFEELKDQYNHLQKDTINKNFIIHEKQKLIDKEKEKAAKLENYKHQYLKQIETVKSLSDKILEYEKSIKKLNQHLDKSRTEVNVFNAKYDFINKKYNFLLSDITSLKLNKDNILDLQNELNRYKQSYIYKENQLRESDLEMNKLQAEINNLHIEINTLNNKLSAAKLTSDDYHNEHIATQEEYDKSLAKIEDLEQTINEMKQSKNKILDDYHIREEEVDRLNNQLKESEKIKIELEHYIKTSYNLKEEISSINKELKEKNLTINELNEKYTGLNQKYTRLKNESDSITNQGDLINNITKNANERIQKHNRMKERISELEKNVSKIQNDNTIKELELNKYRTKTSDLEQLLKTRYEQIQILEEQLNKHIEKYNKSKIEKTKLAEKIDKYIIKIDTALK